MFKKVGAVSAAGVDTQKGVSMAKVNIFCHQKLT